MASGDKQIIRHDAKQGGQRAARAEQDARNAGNGKATGRGNTNDTQVRRGK